MTPARRGGGLLLAPGLLWLALFTFLPLVLVLATSLADRGRPVTWELSGAAWGRLADPLLLRIFLRSLLMALAATALCALVGVPFAAYLAGRPPRTRRVLYFLVVLPLWANSLALTYAWRVILRTNGLADAAARASGLLAEDGTLGWLNTPGAVLLGLVYAHLPFMVYAVYGSAEKLDRRLVEAALDLGATRLLAARRVVLPQLRPGLVAGSVLVFVPSLGAFVVPQLLGGSRTAYLGTAIQDRFLHEPLDWPLGAALGAALIGVTAAAMALWFRHAREPLAHG